MTTAQLLATLRTQLADAQRPGLAGVRALEATTQTVNALEDAVKLTEQRGATREAQRYGEMLRLMSSGDPAKIYEAEQTARIVDTEVRAAGGKLAGPGPDAVYDTWHEEQRQKWQDIQLENPRAIQHI